MDLVWDLYLILSTCKNGQIRSAGPSGGRPVGKTGDRLGHLGVDLQKNFSGKIFIQKNFQDLSREHLSPLTDRNETIISSR